MSSTDAIISEAFLSIQGEGPYVGERQVFVRFSGCNLACDYCDTLDALQPAPEYRVEKTPGGRDFNKFKNPVGIEDLSQIILGLAPDKNLIHSVCITGGEPLLQVDFLKNFLTAFQKEKIKIYLETNGTLPKHLEEIIDLVDIISSDIKLPTATGCDPYFKEHRAFLEVAKQKEVFVKVVVAEATTMKEIIESAKLIEEISPDMPMIIQPASVSRKVKRMPSPLNLLAWQAAAKRHLKIVRIIPQSHKLLGMS